MLKQIALLGIRCHLFTIPSLNQLVLEKVKAGAKVVIAHQNLHGVFVFHKNQRFKAFLERADYVHIDGMPLVYWGKIVGYKVARENRITYMDWIDPLMEMANLNQLRIFHLGGKPGVGSAAVDVLKNKYGSISFEERHGYFDMADPVANGLVLDAIQHFRPHILMVGMGMPRQETWISNNLEALPQCVILPCGACFDYIGGKVKTPPRFLGAIGLEWLYRFLQEPKRLFSRYFYEPIFLLPLMFKDLINIPRKNRM